MFYSGSIQCIKGVVTRDTTSAGTGPKDWVKGYEGWYGQPRVRTQVFLLVSDTSFHQFQNKIKNPHLFPKFHNCPEKIRFSFTVSVGSTLFWEFVFVSWSFHTSHKSISIRNLRLRVYLLYNHVIT